MHVARSCSSGYKGRRQGVSACRLPCVPATLMAPVMGAALCLKLPCQLPLPTLLVVLLVLVLPRLVLVLVLPRLVLVLVLPMLVLVLVVLVLVVRRHQPQLRWLHHTSHGHQAHPSEQAQTQHWTAAVTADASPRTTHWW